MTDKSISRLGESCRGTGHGYSVTSERTVQHGEVNDDDRKPTDGHAVVGTTPSSRPRPVFVAGPHGRGIRKRRWDARPRRRTTIHGHRREPGLPSPALGRTRSVPSVTDGPLEPSRQGDRVPLLADQDRLRRSKGRAQGPNLFEKRSRRFRGLDAGVLEEQTQPSRQDDLGCGGVFDVVFTRREERPELGASPTAPDCPFSGSRADPGGDQGNPVRRGANCHPGRSRDSN